MLHLLQLVIKELHCLTPQPASTAAAMLKCCCGGTPDSYGLHAQNATTWMLPGEIFPTEVRATCHGISAATGKAGALVAGIWFAYLTSAGRFYVSAFFNLAGLLLTILFVRARLCTLQPGLAETGNVPGVDVPLKSVDVGCMLVALLPLCSRAFAAAAGGAGVCAAWSLTRSPAQSCVGARRRRRERQLEAASRPQPLEQPLGQGGGMTPSARRRCPTSSRWTCARATAAGTRSCPRSRMPTRCGCALLPVGLRVCTPSVCAR